MLCAPMRPPAQPPQEPPFKIRALVALGVMAVLLPSAIAVWAALRARDALVRQIEDAQLTFARHLAAEIHDELERSVRGARTAARSPALAPAARGAANERPEILETLYTTFGTFRRLSIMDPAGRLLLTYPPPSDAPPLETLVMVREPLGGAGGGVLIAEISARPVLSQIEQTRFGDTGAATVIDRDSRVIASSDVQRRNRVLQAPEILEQVRLWREGTPHFYSPILQRREIGTIALVEGYPLAVLVTQSQDEAFTPISHFVKGLAAGFGALVLLGVALAWSLSRDFADYEERLRALSLTDSLTGLFTRRGFLPLAEEHLELARRTLRPFLVGLIDVDGLKRINDALGHASGDAALVAIADVLRETFREADILGRVGGDEFAVVVVEAAAGAEESIADRLRRQLDDHNVRSGHRPATLSCSIGFARYAPESLSSLVELLAAADQALYEDKRRRSAAERPARAAGAL
jgi:diguanylate cyclase (GGDEF)-like protein